MGIGFRSFIFGNDGSLWRLPEQLRGALAIGQIRLPECAGAIEALGMHRESKEDAVSAGGNVVDISRPLRRRRWWAEHRWEPTPADITRMINAIWAKAAGRPVEPLRSITTSWKRRKPVSRSAGWWAVDRCREHVYAIQRELRELSESDLNGVMTKLNEQGGDTVIDACLWGGVAEACKQEIERRKAWRRRKGRWYAFAERIEPCGDRQQGCRRGSRSRADQEVR